MTMLLDRHLHIRAIDAYFAAAHPDLTFEGVQS